MLNDKYKLNHCKEMGAEPGRRFLIQPAAKLESESLISGEITQNDVFLLFLTTALCYEKLGIAHHLHSFIANI